MTFDVDAVRAEFPALALRDDGVPRVYLDNPGGTQVPQVVLARMSRYLVEANANLGGSFRTSRASGEILAEARAALADLLNAPSDDEIVFGANMTSLTFQISRAIGPCLAPGDEIVLSTMDHDGNVSPWLLMAEERGLTVKWLPFEPETFEFDLDRLGELLSERTRLVCISAASNFIGTLNDIPAICAMARAAGAWSYVDAVQAVPHAITDVQAMGCDFAVCSAYKFFGPHVGILWGRREAMERLKPVKVRAAPSALPQCFETGTQNHEGLAGLAATVEYLAWIGETMAGGQVARHADFSGRRQLLRAALDCLFDYEMSLTLRLISGLRAIPGLRLLGIASQEALTRRVPTVAFTVQGQAPSDIARALAHRNVFVWSGSFYAIEAAALLGVQDSGGAVRVGPVHYNTLGEIEAFLETLEAVTGRREGNGP